MMGGRRKKLKEWGIGGKPLIVGEADPLGQEIGDGGEGFYERGPSFALWPEPAHFSGGRLCAIMGLHPRTFVSTFDRTNLFRTPPKVWNERHAAIAAGSIPVGARTVLLLGRKVHRAFGLKIYGEDPFWDAQYDSTRFLLLPHPSSLNREWRDVTLVPRLREFLWNCLCSTGIPFGEADDSFGFEARKAREWSEYVRVWMKFEEVRAWLARTKGEDAASRDALIRVREILSGQMEEAFSLDRPD